eukprot:1820807-Ditylum_brightwellii.AAC.1
MEFTTHFDLQSQATCLFENTCYDTKIPGKNGSVTLSAALFQGTWPETTVDNVSPDHNSVRQLEVSEEEEDMNIDMDQDTAIEDATGSMGVATPDTTKTYTTTTAVNARCCKTDSSNIPSIATITHTSSSTATAIWH